MNYSEYVKTIENVEISNELEFASAIMWVNRSMLPVGLVSIGNTKMPIIKVPDWVENSYGRKVPVIAIAGDAFAGNEFITDIVLPAGIERLSPGAFAGCTELRNITIPERIKYIPEGTFAGCVNLKNIYYEGTMEDWKKVEVVHNKHEIKFGALIPGTPVYSVEEERLTNIPGNEAVFSANIHFRCDPKGKVPAEYHIELDGKDVTNFLRTM